MKKQTIFKHLVYPLFVILVFAFFYFFSQVPKKSDNLIVFCNVGQGDAAIIKNGDYEILIDAGPDNGEIIACLSKYLSFQDRTIEKVVASHYDADHIGGFRDIFFNFEVKEAYGLGSQVGKDTVTYKTWMSEINKEGISEQSLIYGRNLNFPGGYLETLYPFYNSNFSATNLSVVLKAHYLQKTFLFTGDLELAEWQKLEQMHLNLQSKVLKVAHHGSKNGTDQTVLDAVKPDEAVISVGKNSYGHPAKSVLDLLDNNLVTIHRTDQEGDLVYK